MTRPRQALLGAICTVLLAFLAIQASHPVQAQSKASAASLAAHKTVLTKEVSGQYAFVAKKLTVTVGTTVTWKNVSDAPHTVTGKGSWKANMNLPQGKSVSFVFKKPGTYHYYCAFHPYMKATIVVKG
jgi:plastocyanin